MANSSCREYGTDIDSISYRDLPGSRIIWPIQVAVNTVQTSIVLATVIYLDSCDFGPVDGINDES